MYEVKNILSITIGSVLGIAISFWVDKKERKTAELEKQRIINLKKANEFSRKAREILLRRRDELLEWEQEINEEIARQQAELAQNQPEPAGQLAEERESSSDVESEQSEQQTPREEQPDCEVENQQREEQRAIDEQRDSEVESRQREEQRYREEQRAREQVQQRQWEEAQLQIVELAHLRARELAEELALEIAECQAQHEAQRLKILEDQQNLARAWQQLIEREREVAAQSADQRVWVQHKRAREQARRRAAACQRRRVQLQRQRELAWYSELARNAETQFLTRTLQEEECPICLEQLRAASGREQKPITMLSCGHAFHNPCMRPWLRRSKDCPYCRAEDAGSNSIFVTYRCAPPRRQR